MAGSSNEKDKQKEEKKKACFSLSEPACLASFPTNEYSTSCRLCICVACLDGGQMKKDIKGTGLLWVSLHGFISSWRIIHNAVYICVTRLDHQMKILHFEPAGTGSFPTDRSPAVPSFGYYCILRQQSPSLTTNLTTTLWTFTCATLCLFNHIAPHDIRNAPLRWSHWCHFLGEKECTKEIVQPTGQRVTNWRKKRRKKLS